MATAPIETFRIPGTMHRLLLPMLIFSLVAVTVALPIVVVPDTGGPVFGAAMGLIILALARKHLWVIARRAEVSPEGLRLLWALRSRMIPADRITDAHLVLWETIERPEGWRRDGFHGLWNSPDLGLVEIYATQPGNLVMIYLLNGPPLLLGVEFPDELVEAVEAHILRRSSLY